MDMADGRDGSRRVRITVITGACRQAEAEGDGGGHLDGAVHFHESSGIVRAGQGMTGSGPVRSWGGRSGLPGVTG